jgi:hypothetical protein
MMKNNSVWNIKCHWMCNVVVDCELPAQVQHLHSLYLVGWTIVRPEPILLPIIFHREDNQALLKIHT